MSASSRSAHRIVSDPEGFLWIATSGGLSQFDGDRFTTPGGLFHEVPLQGVPRGDQPFRLLVGCDGVLWVETFENPSPSWMPIPGCGTLRLSMRS